MIKSQQQILEKLGIARLNAMQIEAQNTISSTNEIVLLSPTGTGKTLAFLLPIIAALDPKSSEIQVLIVVPSRELALQIERVAREMGTGYKINAVYGGRAGSKDKVEIKHIPAILIGTPGRIADHLRRENISTEGIKTLVLDEFDKSLEIGFESDMSEIINALVDLQTKILTSATKGVEIPAFVELSNPTEINYLGGATSSLKMKAILSPSKNKLPSLVQAISHLSEQSGIVFCNLKETIQDVSDALSKQGIGHGCFYGGMEQVDRERALIKFRNGTHQILVATDLAARGIDVPELNFIIHYQIPVKSHEFTHRNGRTARMHSDGTAYILKWEKEKMPDFIDEMDVEVLTDIQHRKASFWQTIFLSGGRKDKISKGDIAGFMIKQGQLNKEDLGIIELKRDCAFVAISKSKAASLIQKTNNTRLKKKKVRVTMV